MAAWESFAKCREMRNLLSADVYEPDVYHHDNAVDRRERRAQRRGARSSTDDDRLNPDDAANGEMDEEQRKKLEKECAERNERFKQFQARQEHLRDVLDPVADRLTRKNCITLETFETLDDRRTEPNPPEDKTCRLLSLGSDIIESIVIAIVSGQRTRSSDEKMLHRLSEQLRIYGKEIYVALRHSASFWRAAASIICLVHKANQPIITAITGLKPPDVHRKNAEVFGRKWRCVGTSLPSAGADGKPLVQVKRYGRLNPLHRGPYSDYLALNVSDDSPLGPIIEEFLAHAANEAQSLSGDANFKYTEMGVVTLPLYMIMTRPLVREHSRPIFRFCSNSYVKVDAVKRRGVNGCETVHRPELYFVPVDEGEKTTEQMGLLLPQLRHRQEEYQRMEETKQEFVLHNTAPRRYKMPEMFDFMLQYAVRVMNERFRLAWEKRFQAWRREHWNGGVNIDGAREFYMTKHPFPREVPENDKNAWAEVLRVRNERLNERKSRKRKERETSETSETSEVSLFSDVFSFHDSPVSLALDDPFGNF